MKYFGLQSQIRRNNTNSVILLLMFPVVFYVLTWLFFFFTSFRNRDMAAVQQGLFPIEQVNHNFLAMLPWITIGVIVWFIVAWFNHTSMISKATDSKPLERKDNKRVYNLVENLCIATGMTTPKINIIDDDSLNAFASGINEKSFTISLSRGIINRLDDQELEAVIAHELTHIRNRDVRLLIISIIFVGIFAFISESIFRSLRYGNMGRNKKAGAGILIALVLAAVGYLIASLFRFSLSRKREYLADAGAAELTRNPLALASALKKVSADPTIEAVRRKDVAQLFIENPQVRDKNALSLTTLFATHPPILKRIAVLEQF